MRTKAAIREDLRAKRAALTPDQVAAASKTVSEKVLREVDWVAMQSAHIYAGYGAWNELDTAELCVRLKRLLPDIAIDVPAIAPDAEFPDGQFDAIIVPVLGFDRRGYRLGLGKGWYDRFLAGQPQALKIGLAYSWAEVPALPHEPHDVPLNVIVTERGVITSDSSA